MSRESGVGSREPQIRFPIPDSRFPIPCFLLLTLLFTNCGLEEYYYLAPVSRDNNITVTSIDKAVIRLPNTGANYFTHFAIYYRIYVSNYLTSSTTDTSSSALSLINSTLASDYYAINPYISSDTLVGTNIGTLFSNRKFYTIEVNGANVRDVLGSSSQGQTITLDFLQSNNMPTLSGGNWSYHLYRSTDNGRFRPQPDRYFVNTSTLYDPQYINDNTNADVVDKTGISGTKYTYVLLYIVVTGLDSNLSPVYSTPSYIGILKLPDDPNR